MTLRQWLESKGACGADEFDGMTAQEAYDLMIKRRDAALSWAARNILGVTCTCDTKEDPNCWYFKTEAEKLAMLSVENLVAALEKEGVTFPSSFRSVSFTPGHEGDINYMQTPLQIRLREMGACREARVYIGGLTLAEAWNLLTSLTTTDKDGKTRYSRADWIEWVGRYALDRQCTCDVGSSRDRCPQAANNIVPSATLDQIYGGFRLKRKSDNEDELDGGEFGTPEYRERWMGGNV